MNRRGFLTGNTNIRAGSATMGGEGKHKWFVHPKFKPLVTCKYCGIVMRADGKNSPCKGKVRVVLKENRVRAAS